MMAAPRKLSRPAPSFADVEALANREASRASRANDVRREKAANRGAVGGGVTSAKPTHGISAPALSKKPQPDLAVSMKQMLRRKGGTK